MYQLWLLASKGAGHYGNAVENISERFRQGLASASKESGLNRNLCNGGGLLPFIKMKGNSILQRSRYENVCRLTNGQDLEQIHEMEELAREAGYSCATLAQLCGVSLRQLQRRFHAYHGETLGQWLNRVRLKYAFAQLAEGNTVKETTFSLGYKQVSHFSRHFKKFYGINPSTVCISTRADHNRPLADAESGATQLLFF